MSAMLTAVAAAIADRWEALLTDERGAIGWLIIGIIIGAVGVIYLLVKLLIPGD